MAKHRPQLYERTVAARQLRKTLPWAHELLVVGDRNALRVHVRTGRPDLALGIGLACGVVADIVVKADTRSPEVEHPVC